jgi:hypothetical protein
MATRLAVHFLAFICMAKTGDMTNYVYLLYGPNEACFLEAAYSVGTLLKRIDPASGRVIIFTDQPEKIAAWPVVCESITGQLAAMQGETHFIHRTKLCVILRCLEQYSGNVLFLDSDTFVRGDLRSLTNKLSPGRVIMDSFESKNPLPELTAFQTTFSDRSSYHYTKAAWMCNSGVMGVQRQDALLIQHALELCDALLATGSKRHTLEQFSLSEIFRISRAEIIYSKDVIVHYVKTKTYMRRKIAKHMRRTRLQPWEFERAIPYWYPFVRITEKISGYFS